MDFEAGVAAGAGGSGDAGVGVGVGVGVAGGEGGVEAVAVDDGVVPLAQQGPVG
jgi:hypothetical protein